MSGSNPTGPPIDSSPGRSAPLATARMGITLLLTVAAGVALWIATDAASRLDSGGPGWSLKGNGALGITFTVAPAVLATSWMTMALMYRKGARPTVIGVGLAALVLAFGVVFGPFLPLGFWPALFSPIVALAAGHALAERHGISTRGGMVAGAALVGLFLISVLGQRPWTAWAYQLAPLLIAPLLTIPAGVGTLSREGRLAERAATLGGCLLVPVALSLGLICTGWLISALGPR